jgi:DNA-binding transcriptional LysR family regulator
MNVRFLEAFVWAARLGSFRTAAERLNITQAAISNRIASLEDDFQTKLFDRDARETKLTFAGRRMLVYAERMLDLNLEMMSASRKTSSDVIGTVRIGVVETIVHTWLSNFLQRMQDMYPGIEIQLTSESTLRLHAQMRQGELDIALQTDPLMGESIHNTASGAIAMGWVGRSADWMDKKQPSTVIELTQYPIITMNKGSQPHIALKELCKSENVSSPRVHCVSSISAIVRLVRCGFGIAVLPLAPARSEIESGELTIIACTRELKPQRLVVSYCVDPTTEAIQLVAALASEEAARFTIGLEPRYGFDATPSQSST